MKIIIKKYAEKVSHSAPETSTRSLFYLGGLHKVSPMNLKSYFVKQKILTEYYQKFSKNWNLFSSNPFSFNSHYHN